MASRRHESEAYQPEDVYRSGHRSKPMQKSLQSPSASQSMQGNQRNTTLSVQKSYDKNVITTVKKGRSHLSNAKSK